MKNKTFSLRTTANLTIEASKKRGLYLSLLEIENPAYSFYFNNYKMISSGMENEFALMFYFKLFGKRLVSYNSTESHRVLRFGGKPAQHWHKHAVTGKWFRDLVTETRLQTKYFEA